jgi:uncharacterized protein (DUF169 family)
MSTITDFKEALETHLSLRSFPIAVKLVKRGEDLPSDAGRPLQNLGERITPCVGWHLARHLGLTVAMSADDFSSECPSSLFIFGVLEPRKEWIDGDLAYGLYAGNREAARTMEANVPRLAVGEFDGLVFGPLEKAGFVPDLMMVFCNSRDAMLLITASAWETGEPLRVSMAARGLCADGIVQAYVGSKPVLAVPCGGDRAHGGTQDDELVFVTPLDRLEGIIAGLEAFRRVHQVDDLGGEPMFRRPYSQMAATLDRVRQIV